MNGPLRTPCLDLQSPACSKDGLASTHPSTCAEVRPVCLDGSAFPGLKQGRFVVAAFWLSVLVCCLCFAFFQGRHLHAPP